MLKVLSVLISYFLGNILFAKVVASLKKVDFKGKGSGNPGATNTFRVMGPAFGGLTLLGDTLKGVLAVYLGELVGGAETAALCGLAVVIGHNWPVFFSFQGGKGIATSLGAIIVLVPKVLWVLIPLWILVFLLSRYVSLASLAAAIALTFAYIWLYPVNGSMLFFLLTASILAIYRHKANIQRLLSRKENRINLGWGAQAPHRNNQEDQEENK